MGKGHTKPKTEVHIIHHYMDRQNSETESDQDLYRSRKKHTNSQNCSSSILERDLSLSSADSSSSKVKSPSYSGKSCNLYGTKLSKIDKSYSKSSLDNLDKLNKITSRNKILRKCKAYSHASLDVLEDSDDLDRNKFSKNDKTYSQACINVSAGSYLSKTDRINSQSSLDTADSYKTSRSKLSKRLRTFDWTDPNRYKLSKKDRILSQPSIMTIDSEESSTSAQKRKSLSHVSLSPLSKTSPAEEWDFDSNFFEDCSDNSLAHQMIIEETSSVESLPKDMYIRYQSVKDLSRLFYLDSDNVSDDEDSDVLISEESDESDYEYHTFCNLLERETMKPLEYIDYFEVDQYGCVICTNIWSNVMWREALRRSSGQLTLENMATTLGSSTRMFGPPRIPKTPSKAINNMLYTRCGKPFDQKPKFLVASVICGVFNIITMLYDQIHKDKLRPSHKIWMISCGVIATTVIVASILVYNIIIHSAFALHALLYYGCTIIALVGVGLCVSGMVFFDKEAGKEDFEKER